MRDKFAPSFEGGGLTMSDEPDELQSKAEEQRPTKIKAENNPWYLLATL